MDLQPLSLFELNEIVAQTLQRKLSDYLWVIAEISSLHRASNGHYYMELVERDPEKGLVAKAAAHIWRNVADDLMTVFEYDTKTPLHAGMKVMLLVRVEFHALYGYSLNVVDIDATYTLGEMAQRSRQIWQQLQAEGVADLNRQLPLSVLPLRIAVITSASAAGYGDFTAQLAQSGFRFHTRLFPSLMQGEGVQDGVVNALDQIFKRLQSGEESFDVVVLIRGGGAVSDLSGFDNYELAYHVAQFPLPVLTGIGHERDETVVDRVAYHPFKTPTAVAAFLIDRVAAQAELLAQLEAALWRGVQHRLGEEKHRYQLWAQRFAGATGKFLHQKEEQLTQWRWRVQNGAQQLLLQQRWANQQWEQRLQRAVVADLEKRRTTYVQWEKALDWASPERIMKRGFALVLTANGQPAKAASLQSGDVLQLWLADGKVQVVVQPDPPTSPEEKSNQQKDE